MLGRNTVALAPSLCQILSVAPLFFAILFSSVHDDVCVAFNSSSQHTIQPHYKHVPIGIGILVPGHEVTRMRSANTTTQRHPYCNKILQQACTSRSFFFFFGSRCPKVFLVTMAEIAGQYLAENSGHRNFLYLQLCNFIKKIIFILFFIFIPGTWEHAIEYLLLQQYTVYSVLITCTGREHAMVYIHTY